MSVGPGRSEYDVVDDSIVVPSSESVLTVCRCVPSEPVVVDDVTSPNASS